MHRFMHCCPGCLCDGWPDQDLYEEQERTAATAAAILLCIVIVLVAWVWCLVCRPASSVKTVEWRPVRLGSFRTPFKRI